MENALEQADQGLETAIHAVSGSPAPSPSPRRLTEPTAVFAIVTLVGAAHSPGAA